MFVSRPHGDLFYTAVEPTEPWIAEPETVVFLHGVAVTHEMWAPWVSALSARYRLILIDTRGCGQSGAMSEPGTWTLDNLSDDILAVADAAGARDFHVIAESFGGTGALNLAARGLRRVLTTTAVSTAHRGGQIERVKAWRKSIEDNGVVWWSEQMMDRRFMPGAITAEQHAWFRSLQDKTPAEALLRKGEMLLETDLTEKLPDITSPLLLITPDRSPFVTPDISLEILTRVPTASLAVLPHTRHGIFYSHGAICAEHWRTFKDRVASNTRAPT